MNSETTTSTIASTTNAAIACHQVRASFELMWITLLEASRWVAPAAAEPAIMLRPPASQVLRFQNMAMMKVANSGALKIANRSWT